MNVIYLSYTTLLVQTTRVIPVAFFISPTGPLVKRQQHISPPVRRSLVEQYLGSSSTIQDGFIGTFREKVRTHAEHWGIPREAQPEDAESTNGNTSGTGNREPDRPWGHGTPSKESC